MAYIVGIVYHDALFHHQYVSFFLSFAILCSSAIALQILKKKKDILLLWTCIILSTFIGALYTQHQITEDQALPTARSLKITLVDLPKSHPYSTTALCKVEGFSSKVLAIFPAALHPSPEYADTYRVEGQCSPFPLPTNPGQFNARQFYLTKGIAGTCKITQAQLIHHSMGNPINRLAYALRTKIVRLHQRCLPPPYGDLLTGFVFGEAGAPLPDTLKEAFMHAGFNHLLVVSGSQVSLLCGILVSILTATPLSPPLIFGIITAINILFFVLSGGGPSILRAMIMSETVLGLQLIHRNISITHVMTWTAGLMLIQNPLCLYDLGFQLSFAATLSLLVAAKPIEESLSPKIPSIIRSSFAVSLSPFLTTIPILWYSFNTLPLVSLFTNIVVTGAVEGIVTLGFFSTVIGLILPPLGQIGDNANWLGLKFVEGIASLSEHIPYALYYLQSPPVEIILFLYLFLGLSLYGLSTQKRSIFRWGIGGVVGLISIGILMNNWPSSQLKIFELDVGQGDGMIILTPHRKCIVVDTGPCFAYAPHATSSQDAGKQVMGPALKHLGINTIDLLILSHFDLDHAGGAPYLLRNFKVKAVIDNQKPMAKMPLLFQEAYFSVLASKKIKRLHPLPGQQINLEPHLSLTFLSDGFYNPTLSENNNSIVCRLLYRQMSFLLTGDIEEEQEYHLASKWGHHLASTFLKCAHHGSRTSNTEAFIETVHPQFCTISVGKNNKYGHPGIETLERLSFHHIPFMRTDENGAILFSSDGQTLTYKGLASPPHLK